MPITEKDVGGLFWNLKMMGCMTSDRMGEQGGAEGEEGGGEERRVELCNIMCM